MNPIIDQIINRQSCPKLKAPAPSKEELTYVLRCALRAPDHGRIKPWRFNVMTGKALDKLGEFFKSIKLDEDPGLSEALQQKYMKMPKRAPMIIVALADTKIHPKVPAIEQAVAVGCALQNMQIALASLGYGAMWRTGEFAFDQRVKAYFDAKQEDEIIGFLYVGTPEIPPKSIKEQAIEEAVSFWTE